MVFILLSEKLRAEEKATDIVSRFMYRLSKNRLGAKLGIYIPAGVLMKDYIFGTMVILL